MHSGPHEARKTVTLLFADVVSSTGLGERLDPEALRNVMSRYFAEMADVVERHGGTVEKFIGDEVMAVFGVPSIREDDALRAVRAAATMQDRLRDLNDELSERWGAHLEIRIGINTGEVLAGDPSSGHGFVTGDAVNVAKRIEQAAGAGEILMGEATYQLIRHAVKATSVGPFALKGKQKTVAAHRLDEVDHASGAFARRLDVPIVGRVDELARLDAAYRRAVETRTPQLATILGPAGIGKSRLALEFRERVVGEAVVLVGRCLAYGDGITFWPIREILPEERFEGSAEEIFWRIRKRLEALAAEQPLVVCFEDVHWAETTFLDLVQYLAGWIRDRAVLLLCVARPELLERRPDWPKDGSDARLLTLGPLPEPDARLLLDSLDVPDEARDRIATTAEGNPLFVEQMAALAADEGATVAFPPSIRALLAARLDRLEPDEGAVIDRAAVIGREFALRAVVELAPAELQPRVSTLLLGLVRKELVRPHAVGDDDVFRFRHALIRDAAYEAIPKQLRADLHRLHAVWLDASGGAAILVGYHLEQTVMLQRQLGLRSAPTEELAVRAGSLLSAAGRRAFRRGDTPAAVALLGRAAALLSDDDGRLELDAELSAALFEIGESRQADALLEQTIEGATARGDRRVLARAEIVRSKIRMQRARPAGAAEDVARVAERAIEVFADEGDEVGLAQAWTHLSRVHLLSSRWGAATEALEQALVHARRAGDRREEAMILGQLALALYWGPTPVQEAIARCEEMLAETGRDRTVEARVTVSIAGLEAMRGRFERARELYAQSRDILVDLGLRPLMAAHTLALFSIETLAGDPGAAESELRVGAETLEDLGLRSSFSTLASALARTAFEQGRTEEAEELVERARLAAASDDVASEVLWRTTRARLLAARGELEAAERDARQAVELAEGTDALNLHADSLVDLAEILAARGGDTGADAALAEAVRLYTLKGNDVSRAHALALLAGTPA